MMSAVRSIREVRARLSLEGVADRTLFEMLDRALTEGRMRFILPSRTWDVGRTAQVDGSPEFVLRVTDPAFSRRLLAGGNLGLSETYMEGGWTLEKGRLDRFLTALALTNLDSMLRRDPRVLARVAAMRVHHAVTGASQNVPPTYNVGAEVYELILDETMGYTCGYQKTPNDSLRELQENKY